MKRFLILIITILFSFTTVFAKTEKFGTWIEFTLTKKITKKLEFSFSPEFRLQDDFTLDEYNLDGKLAYKPWKFLDFAATYRINTNIKKNDNVVSQKFLIDATGKTNYDRFDASLRNRFTNDAESGNVDWGNIYYRPRAKLKYNIKGSKIEPFTSFELFLDLNNGYFDKGRFDVGFTRKIKKKHEFGMYYRLQDYFSDRGSINILGIDYGFKF